ncbi:MAG TPA: hypothetical protein VMS89_03990 [Methanoregulaceae archaeon]|nr:hypothetical protein [Methanoregulaceae archaeon]
MSRRLFLAGCTDIPNPYGRRVKGPGKHTFRALHAITVSNSQPATPYWGLNTDLSTERCGINGTYSKVY